MFALVIIIALSFFAWQPLLHSGFFTFHDEQQVARLFELNKALLAGQFPVRWVPDLGFGLGYPLFNFYPPFIYYLGEIYHLLGFGFIDSIKLVWFTALIGSALAMYFLAKKYFGKIGGVVSSLFYLYAPYHAIDAYVRGALAELFSFVWLPLILLFSNKPVIAGIFLALLMITHNLIFLPFVGFYVLWSRNIKNIVISLIIAFGLTAFFWLPSLWEKQFTLVDDMLIKNLASYKIHFVCQSQLWESLWGYGGSVAGCIDGMSFKLGKLHIILSFISFLILVIPAKAGIYINRFRLAGRNDRKIIIISFILFVLSVFMTTDYSSFIWDRIPQLWYLQFPWRFLEFAALFSSLLAGSFSLVIASRAKQSFVALFFILVLLFFNVKLFEPQKYLTVTDSDLTSDYEIKQRVSSTSFEYLPKGSPLKASEYKVENEKLKVLSGDFNATFQEYRPADLKIIGQSINGGVLQINKSVFPGWEFMINERKYVYEADYIDSRFPLITLRVPAGEITIIGKFVNTPVRTLGNSISLICFLFLVSWLFVKYGFKRIKK